jgi:hypothetical protein
MDLQWTNVWLGIIAVVTLFQFLGVCAVGLMVLRRLERAEKTVDGLVADVRPLFRRTALALDDAADLAERLRRADASIREGIDRMSVGIDRAKAIALTRFWPALGVARGLRAAAMAIRNARATRARDRTLDTMAESRFVDEGGTYAGSVRH